MSWQTIYHQYDDDALAVFANVGLLRRARKDLENQKVKPIDLSTGQFNSDGQIVLLDAQGVQKATCNCSASSCCKHILAAVLWLQHNSLNANIQEIESESKLYEPEPLLPELLALEPASVIKQVAKSDCRLAIRLLEEWQGRDLAFDDQCHQLKITLTEYDEPIIYLKGSGFQGMLSSIPEKQQKAMHLAVIAKLLTQHGLSWQWPEDLAPTPDAALSLTDDDKSVITTIAQFIQDLLRQGLSHISQSSATQLHLLNMSAKAEGLPRLANYLKTLSQQVKLLADKHFTMDEGQVLRLIAEISAYLQQLLTADETRFVILKGIQRRQYTDQASVLDLIPIDANWWQTQSGAIGATFSFWDKQEKKIIQCTQGRANRLDPMFSRANVWQTLSIWKQTADNLMRAPFKLHAPRLSDEGKLSANGDSFAQNDGQKMLTNEDYQRLQAEMGFTHWQGASDYLSNLSNENSYHPLILHIADYEQLYWDEVEQCIVWAVSDSEKNRAFLRLNWEGNQNHKIDELRFITKEKWPIAAVSVMVNHAVQGIQLVPKTLWLNKGQNIELFYLDFESTPRKKQRSGFVNKIIEYMEKKQQTSNTFVPEIPLASQLVRPILSVLETQACTGRQQLSAAQQGEINGVVRTLEDLGTLWLANQIKVLTAAGDIPPESLLRLVYLCDKFERLQMPLPFQFTQ
ncbi:SWIM zinc finger family protein [Providencia rettgeri]|uniref:SWIM zinc finger family protein n=1 Tax=Providencia rettgeri TaxID=587 RepID=UPI0034E07ADC